MAVFSWLPEDSKKSKTESIRRSSDQSEHFLFDSPFFVYLCMYMCLLESVFDLKLVVLEPELIGKHLTIRGPYLKSNRFCTRSHNLWPSIPCRAQFCPIFAILELHLQFKWLWCKNGKTLDMDLWWPNVRQLILLLKRRASSQKHIWYVGHKSISDVLTC